MQMKKVILVFKTHFDIGFTQLSRDIPEYYKGEMLDRAAGNGFGRRFPKKNGRRWSSQNRSTVIQ